VVVVLDSLLVVVPCIPVEAVEDNDEEVDLCGGLVEGVVPLLGSLAAELVARLHRRRLLPLGDLLPSRPVSCP